MGGVSLEDDWELTSSNDVRTVVLVGKTGNGKSATGNSILGRKAFKSKKSFSGVTTTSELQTTILPDGHIINVIDTPGLFDTMAEPDFIRNEIIKCINLAKDGIHAVLVVLSIRVRLSKEEEEAILSLQTIFGSKIFDYVILVFAGGDELDDCDETFEDFLGQECTNFFQTICDLCKSRIVLFDNKTEDKKKRDQQVDHLISLVNMVVEQNGGQPYSNEIFAELNEGDVKLHDQPENADSLKRYSKREITDSKDQIQHIYEEQRQTLIEMVESKLGATTANLEQLLAEEQAARLMAEEHAQQTQRRSEDEIHKLREHLEKAREELSRRGFHHKLIEHLERSLKKVRPPYFHHKLGEHLERAVDEIRRMDFHHKLRERFGRAQEELRRKTDSQCPNQKIIRSKCDRSVFHLG